MKTNKHTITIAALSTVFALGIGLIVNANMPRTEVDASNYSVSSVPTDIDLNDASESTIRSYYASLNSLSANERKGTNLLKNLKPILKKGQKYLSYGSSATKAVWQAYEIVDRDWNKSPASAISGYNAQTNTITGYVYGTGNSNVGTNPYIHALYVNRDVENQQRAWGNHDQVQWGINQEHVWAKSCGFQDESPAAGARGDLMHLWAGNGRVNGNTHSNYYYGYVDKTKSYNDAGSYASTLSGNLRGNSKTLGGSVTVFEPQDSDKGDIARAIFYMAARYNYLSGSDSDGIDAGNPNLEIVNDVTSWQSSGYQSTTTTTGKMGILQDLLKWNEDDPPDEFEIHRNNLLYNNFTNNRNPFIDFPNWADAIWGTVDENGNYDQTPTTTASPASDPINTLTPVNTFGISNTSLDLRVGETATISACNAESSIIWSVGNNTVIDLNKTITFNEEQVTVTALKKGTTTITATSGGNSVTCQVTVDDPIVTLNRETADLKEGQTISLTASINPNIPNVTYTWNSSDEDVAVVNNGVITALSAGTTTITATSSKGGAGQCTVTVTEIGGQDSFDITNSISAGDTVYLGCSSASTQYDGPSATTQDAYGLYENYDESPDTDVCPLEVCEGHSVGSYAFKIKSGTHINKYLAYEGSKNSLRVTASIDDNSSWTVSFDANSNATITNVAESARVIWWNASSPRFACYTGKTEGTGFKYVQLWKAISGTADPEDYLAYTTPVTALTADESVASSNSITDAIVFNELNLSINETIEEREFGSIWFTSEKTLFGSNTPRYNRSDGNYWVYANNIITIGSDRTNISNIEFTFEEGTLEDFILNSEWGEINGDVWTGDATYVSLKCLNNVKISRIDITHSDIVSVSNAALRFGVFIPQVNWNSLSSNYEISDYGVMFVKKSTLNSTYNVSSISQAYRAGKTLAIVHSNTGNAPHENGYNYMFTAKINITSFDHSDIVYCAQPFIVIDDEYYFLQQMEASVFDYASDEYDGVTNNTGLSKAALQILCGY